MNMLEDTEGRVIAGLMALVVILCAVGVVFAIRAQNDWNDWCLSQGGHVDSSSATGTGIGTSANGQPVVTTTTTTTYYCLSSDGRILDVN